MRAAKQWALRGRTEEREGAEVGEDGGERGCRGGGGRRRREDGRLRM